VAASRAPRSNPLLFAGKIALVVLLVVVVVYLVLLSELRRSLQWHLNRLYAAGVPRSWAEVAPPPVPDKDNAALVYEQAVQQLNLSRAERRRVFSYWGASLSSPNLTPADVRNILNRNRQALALIRSAADKPRLQFPLDWNVAPYKVFGGVGPFAYDVTTCAAFLRADAARLSEDGRGAEAAGSWGRCLLISEQLGSGGIPWWPTSERIRTMTLAALHKTLARTQPDPQACHTLFDKLSQPDLRAAYRIAVVTLIPMGLWWFDAAEHDRAQFGVFGKGSRLKLSRWPGKLYLSPAGRLIRLREEVGFVEVLQESLSLVDRPYRDSVAGYAALRRRLRRAPSYHLITRELVLAIIAYQASLAVEYERVKAAQRAMQVAVALKAYHAQRGAYPVSLDAARDYLKWKVPEDPFSGKDFGYRRSRAGFVLYSWGEDLRDNGGKPDRDMVWEFER
jgi:hypothetical protein